MLQVWEEKTWECQMQTSQIPNPCTNYTRTIYSCIICNYEGLCVNGFWLLLLFLLFFCVWITYTYTTLQYIETWLCYAPFEFPNFLPNLVSNQLTHTHHTPLTLIQMSGTKLALQNINSNLYNTKWKTFSCHTFGVDNRTYIINYY